MFKGLSQGNNMNSIWKKINPIREGNQNHCESDYSQTNDCTQVNDGCKTKCRLDKFGIKFFY